MYPWVALSLLALSAHATSIDRLTRLEKRAVSAAQIRAELGQQLSANAVVIDADHGDFERATLRWQEYTKPKFVSVVEVATKEDVVKTVAYANKNSIPILAKNGGHGSIRGLGDVKDGIQITLARLNGIKIHDNNTVTVQGGALTYEVRDALWKEKKQTTTGVCECTGFLGPALGGGHGFTQGLYGLAIDNFISARVLLGNGTLVNVSENEHADLWWGLRGAGASFGIVTEVDYKVYDVPEGLDSWYYETWDFDQTVLEDVFEQHNVYLDNMPAGAVLYSMYYRNPAFDATSAVIRVGAMYNGPKSAADSLFEPFRALGPLATDAGSTTYNLLPTVTGANIDGPSCQYGGNRVGGGVYLTRYNIDSQREAYELFNETTAAIPAFNGSAVLFDGFSIEGVSKIPVDSTAMPWRNHQILLTSVISYEPNKTLDQAAEKLSSDVRDILQRTSGHDEMRTYINYAFGNETFPELYGSEQRVARLNGLKREYDPQNVFRFFGPPGGFAM
ncbi:hypothetical protein P3342_000884 [Pyrenophora teres f. teres]|nr:hypothetical protein P3342_000884 [Pyrenophora teres f. teres]